MAQDDKGLPVNQPWKPSAEPVRYDRARVARLRLIDAAVDQLGLPLLRLRKLKGILNALEMQVEDDGDSPEVNRLLLDALRAALRHQLPEPQVRPVLKSIDDFEREEGQRWDQIRAGCPPPVELTLEEQVNDLIQEGYQRLEAGHTAEACDRWLEAWIKVKQLVRPEMMTIRAFESGYPDLAVAFFNWRSDFTSELANAALDDPSYHEQRLRFAREWQALFTGEDADSQVFMRRAEGEALWGLGRQAEAESVYADLVGRYPDNAWGYIGWSDHYWLDRDSAKEYARAEVVLQRALKRPNLEDRSDVLERLEELYQEWGKPREKTAVAAQLEQLGRRPRAPAIPPAAPHRLPPPVNSPPRKIGRNHPCWCGSGKKYKNCHLRQDAH